MLSSGTLKVFLRLTQRVGADRDCARAAVQALAALFDDADMREEARRLGAPRVLRDLLTLRYSADAGVGAEGKGAGAVELDPDMARDACLCLSKLCAEDDDARDETTKDEVLLEHLQVTGAVGSTVHVSRAATVAWASVTRSKVYGSGCVNMVGWADFAEGLVASYTVPAWADD
jgi:hypothetical protein